MAGAETSTASVRDALARRGMVVDDSVAADIAGILEDAIDAEIDLRDRPAEAAAARRDTLFT